MRSPRSLAVGGETPAGRDDRAHIHADKRWRKARARAAMRRPPSSGMVRGTCDFSRCCSGAAILEFALVLPILVALVAGTFELGRALLTYLAIEEAVRGGARYLARVPNPTCLPACSPGASHALDLTRNQIIDNTGIVPTAVRVAPLPDPPFGTVVMAADVDVSAQMLAILGIRTSWTITVTHQEQRVAE